MGEILRIDDTRLPLRISGRLDVGLALSRRGAREGRRRRAGCPLLISGGHIATRNRMLDTVGAGISLVTLCGLSRGSRAERWREQTFNRRALHSGQPLRDLRWVLRGPMLEIINKTNRTRYSRLDIRIRARTRIRMRMRMRIRIRIRIRVQVRCGSTDPHTRFSHGRFLSRPFVLHSLRILRVEGVIR